MARPHRDLDLVLYGATGFTGALVAEYLAGNAPDGLRVGLAGRSSARLEAARERLGPNAATWSLIPADSTDPDSMARLAQSARVVATTVGPYAIHGLPLVEACAHAGTHYVDLSGEVLFMRDSIDRYDALAAGNAARIVHSCGFDSIPSDLGVLDLATRVEADDAGELEDTTLVVTRIRGGFSGGTLASGMATMTAARQDPRRRATLADPYSLSPDRSAEPDLGDQRDVVVPSFDENVGQWVGPFMMGTINTRVVRRSNALLGDRYGRRFRYREVMGFGTGPKAAAQAAATSAGSGGVGALMSNTLTGPGAAALAGRVLPKPGEGPDAQARRAGYFTVEILTRTSTGARYAERVSAQGDPGYAATCVMLAESALCLLEDGDRLPDAAGVLTPATGLGMPLVERLRAAGMTFAADLAPIGPAGS